MSFAVALCFTFASPISGGFTFLEPANDVFIDLSPKSLKVEEHEHGRTDALNFIDQRPILALLPCIVSA